METIQKLSDMFKTFPGIGPRQARRFVYHLLLKDKAFVTEFIRLVKNLEGSITLCPACYRYFSQTKSQTCSVCNDTQRDQTILMVVSRDVDFETVEKSDSFNGLYFILGGNVPILDKNPEEKVRSRELILRIQQLKEQGLLEVILALNANPEGDNTAFFLKNLLKEVTDEHIKVTILGRGLSTGTELEYSDTDTIISALKNRSEAQ